LYPRPRVGVSWEQPTGGGPPRPGVALRHLFRKNHWPVLRAQLESGRLLAVTASRPRYHAAEEGRWDYRVTIVFKDVAAAFDGSEEEALKRQLFPDQEAFGREERRRFEILLAHWDVPVEEVDLGP
jgi:hypothetical protein